MTDPFNHKKIWNHVKRYELKSFDFGIKRLIRDLNENGQHTINSCRGHKGNPEQFATTHGSLRIGNRGYVIFDPRSYNPKTSLSILEKHGLKKILKYTLEGDVILYTFQPILERVK